MNNKLLDYVLMKKEIEMGNKLNQEQEAKFKQMDAVYNSDETIKNEIDKLLNASSLNQAYDILSGKYIEEPVQKVVETEPILNNDNQGGESITNEQEKVLVLSNNKRAGFADALIMALVTGFVGGIATTILFMLI